MILLNGEQQDQISIQDRAVQYGDGVFETIAVRHKTPEFLSQHLARLVEGCQRLSIPFEQLELLQRELQIVIDAIGSNSAVIKITVTRGLGGRGYRPDHTAMPTRIIACYPYPEYPENYYTEGVELRFCQHKLSENPVLAGIKHLNRLDQVIARNEWTEPDIAEGIMTDQAGNIIEGTMSNLFIVKRGKLTTAKLEQTGISGVIRNRIIALALSLGIAVEEGVITRLQLIEADEVFICNSLIGIWPVRTIAEYHYPVGDLSQRLYHALKQCEK